MSVSIIADSLLPQGHSLRVYYLQDSTFSAHKLNVGGYDVVVCSYEFVETSGRGMRDLPGSLNHYHNSISDTLRVSVRSTFALHSAFWRDLYLPFKRLIVDECQAVKKRDGVRHQALKILFVQGTILLSGTLTQNNWHNLSELIDLVKGHSIKDHHGFLNLFSAIDAAGITEEMDKVGMRLLQKFMQVFIIARPSNVVKLKDCKR